MNSARRWVRPSIAVLVGLLVCSASASAVSRPGYSLPTKKLEAAFKVGLHERVASADGCYPPPASMAAAIRRDTHLRAGVATDLKSIHRSEVVYVLKGGARCGVLRMALRYKRGLFVLNSKLGTVAKKGRHNGEPEPGHVGRLRALTLATKTFRVTEADDPQRLLVRCPPGTSPLGGGMTTTPRAGVGGEAVYPHSYERLGAQAGWHISVILIDLTPGDTTPRNVSVQALCGHGLVPAKPMPHATVFVRPGETKTAIARCPEHQFLYSGGFQRTDFSSTGGDFITESRAIGTNAWGVTAHAFGTFGGELTAIASCVASDRPLLTEVSASTPVAGGESATATTPPCPPGRQLTAGGFSANGSLETFFAGGSFNRDGTWSAEGFGYFGPADRLTAYGYCLRASSPVSSARLRGVEPPWGPRWNSLNLRVAFGW